MIQLDTLFNDIGEFGRSQKVMVLMLCFYATISAMHNLAPVFIAYQTDYRCDVNPLDNRTIYPDLNETEILLLTTPYNEETKSFDGCKRFGFNLTECEGNLDCINTSAPVIPCDQGYHFDQSVLTETVASEFNLICDKKYLLTISTSSFYTAMMIGSIAFGNFADFFGRRTCCLVAFTGVLICMVGVAFSPSIEVFIVTRALLAIFSYGTTLGAYVYALEIVGKKWRTLVGMIYQIIFPLGYMILGGFASKWRNWHDMMLASTVYSLPFLLFIIILPESPRWLFAKNKESEGVRVAKIMARINKKVIREETWSEADVPCKQEKVTYEKKYNTLDLFKTRETAIITAKILFNWFTNGIVYYGIALNAGSLAGDLFLNNTLSGVFEMLSYVLCILLMDRIGRRILLSFMMLLAGASLFASVLIDLYRGDSNKTLILIGTIFAFIAKFGIAGSFGIIYNVTSELYPTVIRTIAMGTGSLLARVAITSAPYLLELKTIAIWLPNIILSLLSVVAGLLALTFPETKDKNLMETIEEAEQFYKSNSACGRPLSVDDVITVKPTKLLQMNKDEDTKDVKELV